MRNSLRKIESHNGSILVLALWTLTFLSVYVILLGTHVRSKMEVLLRLDRTSKVQDGAEAGIRIARAVFGSGQVMKDAPISGHQKQKWFQNPGRFSDQSLGKISYEVSYNPHLDYPRVSERAYGFSDEERRININTADRKTLTRLIYYAATQDETQAEDIAKAILDWRLAGRSDIVGFFSDEFYENLEYPYQPQKKDFEVLDELMLVKGIDANIFRKIKDLVTVWGNGRVNINTASRLALYALGLSETLVDRILYLRSGPDGIDGTMDDYIFRTSGPKGSLILPESLNLSGEELAVIDYLHVHGILGIDSTCFRIESRGYFKETQESRRIMCVFDGNSGKILYWREKKGSDPI